MRRLRPIGIVLAVLAVGACGSDPAGPSLIPDPGLLDQTPRYDCGGLAFDPAIFDEPGSDEQAATPQAEILREYILQTAREGEPLPEAGWHLLDERSDGADFLVMRTVPGGEVQILSATIRLGVSYAMRAQWNGCQPKAVMPVGINVGNWLLDPDAAVPRPDTRILRVLVQEQDCSSGRSPAGRIVGPAIQADADRIQILFGVVPLPGAQTCQRSPSAGVEIDLGAAIGDRDLVDPSRWPSVVVSIAP